VQRGHVWCWRKALGVPRFNEGSLRLIRLAGQAGTVVLRGKALPPEQVERRRGTAVELNLGQYLQPCPCPNGSRPWTDDELALPGTMTDHALALRLARSVSAVRIMRLRRGVAPHPDQRTWREAPGAGRPWTRADDRVVLGLDPAAAAERLGRTVTPVYNRRWEIRRAKAADERGR
jgi:hypothetical protein